jgi:hypothetical protein
MSEASSLRKQRKFDDAYAIYKRVAENYASQYADEARRARTDASMEADATKGEADREARAKRAAEEQAAREQGALFQLFGKALKSEYNVILIDSGEDLLIIYR